VSAPPVPADPILAALDVGSSSVRALAFDRRGESLDVGVQRPYEPITTPDGGVEIDADRLVELTAETLDGLVAALGGRIERLAGVATSTFWHTVLGLGLDDRPSTPVYSWADTRSAGAVDELRSRVDEKAYHAMIIAAKTLVQMQWPDVPAEPNIVVGEFVTRFVETKIFWDTYHAGQFANYLINRHEGADTRFNKDTVHKLVEESNLFIDAAYKASAKYQQQQTQMLQATAPVSVK